MLIANNRNIRVSNATAYIGCKSELRVDKYRVTVNRQPSTVNRTIEIRVANNITGIAHDQYRYSES